MNARSRLKPQQLALLLILIWAGWLRLGWPGVNSFSFDEARVSHLALEMVRDGDFAELGMQSSTGVPNFPGAVWLYTLPFALSARPLLATQFTALVSTLAVIGIWWLGREGWGEIAGLAAAAAYAAAPYIVFYSRSIWSQNWLPPLAVLWALSAVLGLSRHKSWALVLHAFLAGFAAQVHFAGVVLALGSLWLGLRFRLWRQWRPVTLGIILGLAAAAPTIYTIWRFGSGARADLARMMAEPAAFHPDVFPQLGRLITGRGWEALWLNRDWVWPPLLARGMNGGSWLLAAAATAGLAVILFQLSRSWRQSNDNKDKSPSGRLVLLNLLPVWLLIAPLFFLYGSTPAAVQYLLPSVPAGILCLAALVGAAKKSAWPAAASAAALIGVALIQTIAITTTLSVSAVELVPGGMGTPLLYPQAAVDRLTRDGGRIVVHAIGDTVEFDGDAAVFDVLLWGYPHQIVEARSVLLIPPAGGHLLMTFDDVPAWDRLQALAPEGVTVALPRRANEPPYMAFSATHIDWSRFSPAAGRLSSGAALAGWRVEELANGRLRLLTHWRIEKEAPSGRIQQFNHLYTTADPSQPAQVSDITTSSPAWRTGDHLLTWAEFDPPAAGEEILHFDVGMYSWPDLQRAAVLERDGDPFAPIRLIWRQP